jgi:small subunit ribosomal protein S36
MTRRDLAAVEGPLSVRRLLAATPRSVWALVVLQVCLGLLYGVAVPVLHGPDEYAHVDRVLGTPLATEDPGISDRAMEAAARVGLQPGQGPVVAPVRADDVVVPAPAADRPRWEDLGDGTTAVEVSQAWDHPVTHYAAVAAVDRALQAVAPADRWDERVGRLRAVHALLLAVVPWAAFWLALRLTRSRGTGLGAALACLALPMVAQTGAIVNNDASVAALGAVCLLALGWVVTGDDSRAAAWWSGGAGGLATATKVFGVAAPAWVLAAAVGARLDPRTRRWPRPAWWGHAAVAGLVLGAWWPLAQLVRTGTLAPRRYTYPVVEDVDASVVAWLGEVVRRIPETFVGSLGLEQFPAPVAVTIVTSLLLLAAGALGVVVLRARSLPLLAPSATALVMMAYASWGAYTRSALASGLRGRYLLVGLVGIVVLVAVGVRRITSEVGTVVAVAVAGVVLHVVLLGGAVDGLWAGDGLVASARTALAAASLGRPVTALVGVVAAAAAVGAAVWTTRDLRDAPVAAVAQPGSVSS